MNWASAAVAMTACGIAFAISPPSLWQQRASSVEKKSDASVFGKSENSLLKVETSQYKVSTDDWKGPVIYGTVDYTSDENPEVYGIYAIDGATGRMAPVDLTDHPDANGSGYYEDGIWRFTSNGQNGDGKTYYYEYDVAGWKCLKKEVLPDLSNLALDVAYDPLTGNVYGCFMDEKGYEARFGFIDYTTHKVTEICRLDVLYFAMFATPDGGLYAIANDGNLYKLDKETGERTKVGPTGVKPKYNQTAVCDLQTGIPYWFGVSTSGTSALYTVDVHTGKAKAVRHFSKREGVVGAFIAQSATRPEAPAKCDNVVIDFPDSSTEGNISFTLPEERYNGDVLKEDIEYIVAINGKIVKKGKGKPGEFVNGEFTVSEGLAAFSINTISDNGSGKVTKINRYIGYDAPGAIGDLNAFVSDGSTVNLNWNAPRNSQNGGFLDTQSLSYRIVRQPGNVSVSNGYKKTEFRQTLSSKKYAVSRYEITPMSHGHEGPMLRTEYLVTGPGMAFPWTGRFSDTGTKNIFVASDSDTGWIKQNEYMEFLPGGEDYLYGPKFGFDGSAACKVTVKAVAGQNERAKLKMSLGKDVNKSSFTKAAFDSVEVVPVEMEYEEESVTEEELAGEYTFYAYPGTAGEWHLAFHGVDKNIRIYSVSVEQGPSGKAPAPVKNLVIAPDSKGHIAANIKFTVPIESVDGSPLSDISTITVYNQARLVRKIDNPTPGEEIAFDDTGVEQGYAKYTVCTENSHGIGIPLEREIFAGEDLPCAPSDLRVIETDEGIRISWKAPVQGLNGAYVNPETMKYSVMRDDSKTIGEELTDCFFIDKDSYGGEQRFQRYAVRASTTAGDGAWIISSPVVVGEDYDLPFVEHFTGGSIDNRFWEVGANSNISFRLNPASGYDGNPGHASFDPKVSNSESKLVTGKISIKDVRNPILTYWYYAIPGASTVMEVYAQAPDSVSTVVASTDFRKLNGEDGWRMGCADLSGLVSHQYIRLGFKTIVGEDIVGAKLDEVTVRQGVEKNLALVLNSACKMEVDKASDVVLSVLNTGAADFGAGSYRIKLYKNGGAVGSVDGPALGSGESSEVVISVTPDIFDGEEIMLKAVLEVKGDMDPNDDFTDEKTVAVKQNKYPMPQSLTGSVNDRDEISLSWSAPDESEFLTKTVTDDVEAYDAFAITDIGDWTTVDMDGNNTYGIGNGAGSYFDYPNALAPKSFMVFNAKESGVAVYDQYGRPTKWAPYSGDQMFVSFQASGGASDDWLISPKLSGEKQIVSFFVHSVDVLGHGAETFEVLYSGNSTDTDDFTLVENGQQEAPAEWTEVQFEIPEGGRYFAIRCVSMENFALMIDDITYSPISFGNISLLGYNVYRDKKLLNQKPLTVTEFGGIVEQSKGSYQVTALYNYGESRPTQPLTLVSSGMEGMEELSVEVKGVAVGIVISNGEGLAASVYSIDGVLMYHNSISQPECLINLDSGVYLVRLSDKTFKVHIK